jgi:hypothetical protein
MRGPLAVIRDRLAVNLASPGADFSGRDARTANRWPGWPGRDARAGAPAYRVKNRRNPPIFQKIAKIGLWGWRRRQGPSFSQTIW